ncbi:hypothetical protein [Neptunitalea chrysea]|nr:hypothetical protein [Neptunitalea chrysea]
MAKRLSKAKKARMHNPILQLWKFIYLNLKIMKIVTGGHGGTRKV